MTHFKPLFDKNDMLGVLVVGLAAIFTIVPLTCGHATVFGSGIVSPSPSSFQYSATGRRYRVKKMLLKYFISLVKRPITPCSLDNIYVVASKVKRRK
jgi:hypothetical protein